MERLRAAWRDHPWLVGSFAVALTVTVFFLVRIALFTVYWADPAHRDQAVQGWMTPGFIAHSWDIPRDAMQEVMGDLDRSGRRRTLAQLSEESGVPLSELISRIEAMIAAQRAEP
jgi:hypothetical protein